ncbi:hypothetical protein [Vibrio alginolyticus]|uniref:hypothetical protein n=1 Tax=Vibrio alginolyticus TaxID=663 RepID=UPI0006CAA275|nr:hypothetical protein [Vibrio alginolyticus]KPM97604.1 hypothetical protein AOG25_14140 [Vibrio alginolyticus]CAH7202984.1 conserved hypothetical protein [Vibrio chagasii]CAH7370102.1 conserved hypothetical protein [Vibrio chagasii]
MSTSYPSTRKIICERNKLSAFFGKTFFPDCPLQLSSVQMSVIESVITNGLNPDTYCEGTNPTILAQRVIELKKAKAEIQEIKTINPLLH